MKWGDVRRMRTVIAVEVVALLAYLAVPAVRGRSVHQRAQRVQQDVRLVAAVATMAKDRFGTWPEDGAPGQTPSSLAPLLPRGFKFNRGEYSLDWDRWSLSSGSGSISSQRDFVGVSVIARDPGLARAIADLPSTQSRHFTVGNRSTFPIGD